MELHARTAVRDSSFHFRIPRQGGAAPATGFLYWCGSTLRRVPCLLERTPTALLSAARPLPPPPHTQLCLLPPAL